MADRREGYGGKGDEFAAQLINATASGDGESARIWGDLYRKYMAAHPQENSTFIGPQAAFLKAVRNRDADGAAIMMQRIREPNFAEKAWSGIGGTFYDVTRHGQRTLAAIGEATGHYDFAERQRAAANATESERRAKYGAGQTSLPGTVSGIAFGSLLAAPALEGTSAAISAAPRVTARVGRVQVPAKVNQFAENLAGAVRTSGTARGGSKTTRALGGAISGAVTSDVLGQDVEAGALVGAGMPLLSAIASGTLGVAFDKLKGRLGRVQAAKVLRNVLSTKSEEVLAALQKAPQNVRDNFAQFLARENIQSPEAAAITRLSSQSAQNQALLSTEQARQRGVTALTQRLAGGETPEASLTNLASQRKAVKEDALPIANEELARVNVGKEQIVPAEQQAQEYRDAAAAEVAKARRLLAGSERRAGVAETQGAVTPGEGAFLGPQGQMPRLTEDATSTEAVQRLRGEAGGMERFGGEAAARSLQLGAAARNAEEIAANLRAQGLEPLDLKQVSARFRDMAFKAKGANNPRARLFTTLANDIDQLEAKYGGVADATEVYEFRKNLGNTIESLLNRTGTPLNRLKDRTASLVAETQPLIDEAFEAAGGTRWKDYLRQYSEGMKAVEHQEFNRQLASLKPQEFVDVVSGRNPEFVENFFGKGRHVVGDVMDTQSYKLAQRLAGKHASALDVENLQLGADVAPSALSDFQTGTYRRVENALAPGFANVGARAVARILGAKTAPGGGAAYASMEDAFARKLSENVRNEIANALASPQSAEKLLRERSTNEIINSFLQNNPAVTIPMSLYTRNLMGVPTAGQVYTDENPVYGYTRTAP